jgi:outer membrane protein OmpA-like peptidoglycan-associated protein
MIPGPAEPVPTVTAIVTAGTVDETDVVISGEPAVLLRQAAEADGQLDMVKVNGDGATTVETYDLTPRDSNGHELKPQKRRQQAIDAKIVELTTAMNSFDTSVDGRSVLAGLQNVPSGSGPILVYSSALDLNDPVSYISLGFDVDPKSVVEQLKATDELPVNLKGRDITFILTPTAGEQKAPRQPQVLYREQLLTATTKAAGAHHVEFIVGQGGMPAGTGGEARQVPIPAPPSTIEGKKTAVTDKDGETTVTTKCVIPSPALFHPDSSKLLDAKAAKTALANCIGHANASTTIRVDGHTACRNAPDSDPQVAKTLSEERARRIADIAVRLGISRSNTSIRGWGDTKPIKKPCSDPANRASVATITTTERR